MPSLFNSNKLVEPYSSTPDTEPGYWRANDCPSVCMTSVCDASLALQDQGAAIWPKDISACVTACATGNEPDNSGCLTTAIYNESGSTDSKFIDCSACINNREDTYRDEYSDVEPGTGGAIGGESIGYIPNEPSSSNARPNPTAANMYFFLITTLYIVLSHIVSTPGEKNFKAKATYFIIYSLLIVLGEYFINVNASKIYCGAAQWKTAIYVTFVPWILIFGLLILMIKIFDGWLSPFANTFGYGMAKLAGLDSVMKHILKPEDYVNDEGLKKSLAEITTDKSIIFNQIPPDNAGFEVFWKEMEPLLNSDIEPKHKDSLRKLVDLKFSTSWYIWYLLSGFLSIAIGMNWLTSVNCTRSTSKMYQTHQNFEKCINGNPEYCPAELATSMANDIADTQEQIDSGNVYAPS